MTIQIMAIGEYPKVFNYPFKTFGNEHICEMLGGVSEGGLNSALFMVGLEILFQWCL